MNKITNIMNEHICENIQTQKQSDTCKLIKFGDLKNV